MRSNQSTQLDLAFFFFKVSRRSKSHILVVLIILWTSRFTENHAFAERSSFVGFSSLLYEPGPIGRLIIVKSSLVQFWQHFRILGFSFFGELVRLKPLIIEDDLEALMQMENSFLLSNMFFVLGWRLSMLTSYGILPPMVVWSLTLWIFFFFLNFSSFRLILYPVEYQAYHTWSGIFHHCLDVAMEELHFHVKHLKGIEELVVSKTYSL